MPNPAANCFRPGLWPALSLALGLAACALPPAPPRDVPLAAVAGRYVGTLPCTGCTGVRTDLTLVAPASGGTGRYALHEVRVGAGQPDPGRHESGQWRLQVGTAGEVLVRTTPDDGAPSGERHFLQASPQVLRLLDARQRELPAAWPRSLVRVPGDVPAQAVVVTAGDDGSVLDLPAGGMLVVMLASNPSTGYGWQPQPGPEAVLGPATRTWEPGAARPGAGGIEVFRFQALRPGGQILRFEYRRPWETDQPAVQAVSFTLRVR